jgi:hypothetical protein
MLPYILGAGGALALLGFGAARRKGHRSGDPRTASTVRIKRPYNLGTAETRRMARMNPARSAVEALHDIPTGYQSTAGRRLKRELRSGTSPLDALKVALVVARQSGDHIAYEAIRWAFIQQSTASLTSQKEVTKHLASLLTGGKKSNPGMHMYRINTSAGPLTAYWRDDGSWELVVGKGKVVARGGAGSYRPAPGYRNKDEKAGKDLISLSIAALPGSGSGIAGDEDSLKAWTKEGIALLDKPRIHDEISLETDTEVNPKRRLGKKAKLRSKAQWHTSTTITKTIKKTKINPKQLVDSSRHISHSHYYVSDKEAGALVKQYGNGKLPKHGYEQVVYTPEGKFWLNRTSVKYDPRFAKIKRGWVWCVHPTTNTSFRDHR